MKNWKYRLIKFAAIVFIIVTLIYPFPNDRQESTAHTDALFSSTPRQATIFDNSRPELRLEQLLGPDYSPRFDLADFPNYPAVASAGRREKGDMNQ